MKLSGRFKRSMIMLLCSYLPCNLVTGDTLGNSWPTDSVLLHIGNLNGADNLWKDAFEEGAKRWNDTPTSFQFLTERTSGVGFCTSTGNNSVQLSSTLCGDTWSSSTAAVTRTWSIGSTTKKTDIIFNNKQDWDVYDGRYQYYAIDFRRVAIHEMGHAAGLAHPIATDVIMSAILNDTFLPALDDVDSLRGLYGSTTHTLTLENSGDGVISVAPLVSGTGVVSDNTFYTSNYGSILDCNASICHIPIQDGLRLIIEAHPNASNGVEFDSWSGATALSNSVYLAPFVGNRTLTAHYSIGFDADADGIADNVDNCPLVANTDQKNTDDDTAGNACDAFPNDPAETLDSDSDGVGDNADSFPNDPAETLDSDNDGVGDNADDFPNDSAETLDSDNDGVGDNADDFPNDPAETLDSDNDGVGDNADNFPNDPAETLDSDNDGIGDNADNCPVIPNINQHDADGDKQGNLCDLDDDNDGVPDTVDALPLNAGESVDTDSDGVGNNADTDDDNDGVTDGVDVFPLDTTESVDTDSDGVGNNADTDDDNDGVTDGVDVFPLDTTESVDTDSDGVGNNADTDDDNDGVLDTEDAFPLDSTRSVAVSSSGGGGAIGLLSLCLFGLIGVVRRKKA